MMKHPHSAAASLTLIPAAPMAFASSKRLTYATNLLMRRAFPRSSSEPATSICVTRWITAGKSASATNASGSSRHGKIWHTSPPSLSRIARRRACDAPTHASTGSTALRSPAAAAATLDILPDTRDTPFMTTLRPQPPGPRL